MGGDVESPIERRRYEILERTMLALRETRERHDVLAVAARGLGRNFRRPCVAYELRNGAFRPVAGTEVTGERGPLALRGLDLEALRARVLVRYGIDDYVALSTDGKLRGLLVLEEGKAPLTDEDNKRIRALALHVSLSLATALAFDQLRRYAAEGAALTEAARTILAFTELEPLADSLCRLALRLVQAESAAIYAPRDGALRLIADVSLDGEPVAPALLPADDALAREGLADVFDRPLAAVALSMPSGGGDGERSGLIVVARLAPFEKAEFRVMETLVSLAALAIRNVDLYEQTTRANRALAESNAFKDDLMAMFAHDFRGPLTVIAGYSELLLEVADPDVRASGETIREQTRRLVKLSEDALALAATQSAGFSLSHERADLTSFLEATIAALDPASARVELDAPAAPVLVSFDRSRLRHAVDNVVGNALKYSGNRVDVIVRTAEGEVRVDVTDTGIGIPADDIETIFLRFGRATNARARGISGSGVGLYIAKKIVEVHGGRLELRSRENEGSTFSIVLPL